MTAFDTLDPYASKEELDREDLLVIGRAGFDALKLVTPGHGMTSRHRDGVARAYAQIARPFGPRTQGEG